MAIYRLTHYSTMDAEASQALRRMQLFLGLFPSFATWPLSDSLLQRSRISSIASTRRQ
jgi:hypothetical protein